MTRGNRPHPDHERGENTLWKKTDDADDNRSDERGHGSRALVESTTLKGLLAGHIASHHFPLIYCLFKNIKYLDTFYIAVFQDFATHLHYRRPCKLSRDVLTSGPASVNRMMHVHIRSAISSARISVSPDQVWGMHCLVATFLSCTRAGGEVDTPA